MLSVARKADCAIAGNAATLASSSEAMIGGFGPNLGVPAGTVVSGSPTVTLPADQEMGFTSSKGEHVTVASSAAPAVISFRKGDAMFLPAGFFVTIGGNEPVQSPAQGMWLSGDGSLSAVSDGAGDSADVPSGTPDSGTTDAEPVQDASGSGNDAFGSDLAATGDALLPMTASLGLLAALAAVCASSRKGASAAQRGRHVRR